jgi:hypothetical protein
MAAGFYERARAGIDRGRTHVKNFLSGENFGEYGINVIVHRRKRFQGNPRSESDVQDYYHGFRGVMTPEGRAIVGDRKSKVHIFDDSGNLLIRSKITRLHRREGYRKLSYDETHALIGDGARLPETVLNMPPEEVKSYLQAERRPASSGVLALGYDRTFDRDDGRFWNR